MARRAALACCLLLPALASAQTTSSAFTITETNDSDQKVNIAECQGAPADGLIFHWTVPNFTVSGTFALIASDQSACPTGSSSTAHNVTIADGISATTASGSYPQSGNVNVPTLLSQLQINCNGAATAVYFCVNYAPGTGAAVANAVTGSLALDLAVPPVAVISTVTPGDSALNVTWTISGGSATDGGTVGQASSYEITATSQLDGGDKHTITVTGGNSARIGGLTNGTPYDVTMVAISPGGNRSADSAPVAGTPQQMEDFWRLYRDSNGREQGGCATGAAGALALILVVPLALRRRRRRS